ncbi:19478_t:CDS:2 [Entrophospora sp. SA101]|nr:19478_t:CDS:2 [Entrophospora sp. SA101]CAJ0925804.1 8213_t:CDS:2 [Entrophospora sp. SA101]
MTDNLDNIIEVEKQNIITTYNESSGSGKKKDQYYIAISNDGEYIARLDCNKDENELNPYVKPSEAKYPQEDNRKQEQTKKDNSNQEEQIKKDNRKLLIWSFSISNTISFNSKPTILVAISRVVPNDMIDRDRPINHLLDKLEEYEELKLKYQNMKELYPLHTQPSSTVIFYIDISNIYKDDDKSNNNNYEIKIDENGICLTSNIGGIVRFLPEVEKNKTSLLITNVKGFYKSLDNLDKPNIYSILNLKRFLFPPKFKKDIETQFEQTPCLEKLLSYIYKNYFLFNQFKNRIQALELYSMLTMEAEQCFFTREELKTQKYGIPTYAISLNNLLLAFTSGNKDIRIYSMESGLFIALKNLDDKDEFLFLEFIHNDERLFIVTRNDTNHKISIKIWDIFNSSPEDFKYEINNNIIPKKFDCLNIARSNGMIFFVKEDGKVLNVLKNIEFKEFKVFENDDDNNNGIKEEKSFTVFKNFKKVDKYLNHWYYCAEDDSDKHKIFDPFEKHSDLGGPKTLLLVDNKEKLVDVDQITPLVNNKEQWNLRVGCRKFELEVTWELTDNSIGINFKLEDTKSNTLQNSAKKISFKKVAFGKDNQNRTNEIKDKIVQKAEGKNKHNKVPFNLCVVPLPNFTVNKIEKKKKVVTTFLAFLRLGTSIIVKSFEIENAFGSVKPDQGTIAAISFSVLFLWIEFVSTFNVYENTSQQSKLELLKLQATFISDYEALDLEDDFLNPPKPDPKYICYNNNNLDSWKERTKSRRGCLYAKYENDNSYIQYILEKKDFDHQDGSLWQIYNKLDDFNDDDVNEKISNLEKKMDAKMDNIMLQLQQLQQLLQRP